MTFIDEFSDCLSDTATWREFSSRDRFGKPTFKTGIVFTARLVEKTKLVRDRNGDEVVSSAQLWLGETADTNLIQAPDVKPDDEIELSNGETPVILRIDRAQDETGLAPFIKIFFK